MATVEMAVKARHEGLEVRATARVVGKSASCITAWEERLSQQLTDWSPNAPDGERRYSQVLWSLASLYLPEQGLPPTYPYRKVWREGLEVAIKVKGSQGHARIEWLRPVHPFTAISPTPEVYANHVEAFNSALRRRATAYRRRQNHYA
jgi:hypothetical protein